MSSPPDLSSEQATDTVQHSWFERFGGKHIVINDKLYLSRYYLVGDGRGRGFEVYLHHLRDIDRFRWLHNHPWRWFFSLVLRGSYVQEVLDATKSRRWSNRVRWCNLFRGQSRYHAIRELQGQSVWTLVVVPPKRNPKWGYWNETLEKHEPDEGNVNNLSAIKLFGTKHIYD